MFLEVVCVMTNMVRRISLKRKALVSFCRKEGIRQLSFFGSVLREDFNPELSDVDVLVEFDPSRNITMLGMTSIEESLAMIISIKQKVDLRTIEELHPIFRENVLRERAVLYDSSTE